ncbi:MULTISPECIES: hypothetical protein [Streptomyces]|uniref:Large ATP-binding protein n=1 Tax=Streptomyces zinciresistens K42 TaxID=700597 RepID=G2GBD2_9ACTN|nr:MULTISPECIES: hypothetical protein [Streptomyces]EGX59228.1 hypothetical protein SZN_14031 [Streptomyces zinciresistens K42]MDT9696531.1 hypothetical protein [Streptomyces sp. P17]
MSTEGDALGPVEAWLEEIAKAAGQELDVVKAVLAEHGVRPQTALPRPHSLRVTEVEFEGVRPAPAGDHGSDAGEEGEPFHFQWKLGPGVWCLASSGKNEAGKSSVLEIVLWCLRGRSGLQRDVQSWLRRVRTEFVLDDETLVVEMTVSNSKPAGTVISKESGLALFSFDNAATFEELMDAFMLERLGLEPLRTQQKRPEGVDGPPLTGELSWPAYASALHINRSGLGHLLGNEARNALPTRLLELFLGAPWAATMVSAAVAQKLVAAQLSAAKARAQAEADERQSKIDELDHSLQQAQDRLDTLPDLGQNAVDLNASYQALTEATEAAGNAQRELAEARTQHDELEQQRQSLAALVHAAHEAALAKAFFHTLKPTVCPRCDAQVTQAQWAREDEGHCSLCTSTLHPATAQYDGTPADDDGLDDVDDDQELRQTLAQVQQAVETAAAALADKQGRATETTAALSQAQSALQDALARPAAGDRRAAELEVARLRGALDERRGRFDDLGDPAGLAPLQRDQDILKAAEKAAHARRTQALKEVLQAVQTDIVTMGRQLGLEMLEAVELGTSATLKVWKGGQHQPYGSLTEGEQLRLKIVTTTALLRHGIRTGVGRHPGLLIIDSPGAEEVDRGDLELMLQGLVQLTETAPQLQVVIATARGQEVATVIPADQLRLAPAGERLW